MRESGTPQGAPARSAAEAYPAIPERATLLTASTASTDDRGWRGEAGTDKGNPRAWRGRRGGGAGGDCTTTPGWWPVKAWHGRMTGHLRRWRATMKAPRRWPPMDARPVDRRDTMDAPPPGRPPGRADVAAHRRERPPWVADHRRAGPAAVAGWTSTPCWGQPARVGNTGGLRHPWAAPPSLPQTTAGGPRPSTTQETAAAPSWAASHVPTWVDVPAW